MDKEEHFYAIGRNVNWCSHNGRVLRFLKKLKIEYYYYNIVIVLIYYII